ncbi:MAG: hypothetical protein ABR915_08165 [Thermoguttaceae bacterium]
MPRKPICLSILVAALVLLTGGGLIVWSWGYEAHPGIYDETRKSTCPERDIRVMWKTRRLHGNMKGVGDSAARGSTDAAINAASRVFNTVELVGLTRGEVIATLGDPKTSSDSIYNFPFWPAPKAAMVYRFDSGDYGWQFNLMLDAQGKVCRVERRWIH